MKHHEVPGLMCEICWNAAPPLLVQCWLLNLSQTTSLMLRLCQCSSLSRMMKLWHSTLCPESLIYLCTAEFCATLVLGFIAIAVWLPQIVSFLQRRCVGNHPHFKCVRRLSWILFFFRCFVLYLTNLKGQLPDEDREIWSQRRK